MNAIGLANRFASTIHVIVAGAAVRVNINEARTDVAVFRINVEELLGSFKSPSGRPRYTVIFDPSTTPFGFNRSAASAAEDNH